MKKRVVMRVKWLVFVKGRVWMKVDLKCVPMRGVVYVDGYMMEGWW